MTNPSAGPVYAAATCAARLRNVWHVLRVRRIVASISCRRVGLRGKMSQARK